MQLSPVQVRILGCLIEKERTTPNSYPLTMNALLSACNQTTNREPVLTLTENTVTAALENLRAAELLRLVYSRSNRVDKYRQIVDEAWSLGPAESALMAVLMLRGPQTVAELRSRTERLHGFSDQAQVEAVLAGLAARPEPLVVHIGRAPGQKEPRWAHLLSGMPQFVGVRSSSPAPGSRSGRSRTQIEPWLSVADATAAVRYYKQAFGAVELLRHNDEEGEVVVAHLAAGGASFWLQQDIGCAPDVVGGWSPVRMIMTVEDPDAVFAGALAAGATEIAAVHEGHGWRIGRVVDPFGHQWEIGMPLPPAE